METVNSFYKPYVDVLAELFYPQRCVGCERRASDDLSRGCFEALPLIGRPFCGRCGAPTAFKVFGCGERRAREFGFDGAQAPLRYEGVGQQLVQALKYRGFLVFVEKVVGPFMAGTLENVARFDVVTPVPLHRSRLAKRASIRQSSWRRACTADKRAGFG